jgi:hypothetical protein
MVLGLLQAGPGNIAPNSEAPIPNHPSPLFEFGGIGIDQPFRTYMQVVVEGQGLTAHANYKTASSGARKEHFERLRETLTPLSAWLLQLCRILLTKEALPPIPVVNKEVVSPRIRSELWRHDPLNSLRGLPRAEFTVSFKLFPFPSFPSIWSAPKPVSYCRCNRCRRPPDGKPI